MVVWRRIGGRVDEIDADRAGSHLLGPRVCARRSGRPRRAVWQLQADQLLHREQRVERQELGLLKPARRGR